MNREARSKFITAYSKVLTTAWADDKYMANLKSNPAATLAAAGLAVPAGVTVHIKSSTGGDGTLEDQLKLWEEGLGKKSVDLYVPAQPQMADGELSDTQLESIAGGSDCCCSCTPCCTCT